LDVSGLRYSGATWFLGVAEWTFGLLLLLGFWNKQLGILGAIGSCFSFIATVTILPFFPQRLGAFCRWFSRND